MYTFSDLLRKIRNEANLTQEELARKLGVSTILITLIETNQKQASKGFIEKLAGKLEVHPSSLTPFVFIKQDLNISKLSSAEKALISAGEMLQQFLIATRAKKLRRS